MTVPRIAALGIAIPVLVAVLAGSGTPAAREGLIAFERDYSIYILKPDGSDLRVLATRGQRDPGGEGDGYLVYPSFTPDGSRVTYLNGIRTTHQSVVVTRVAGGAPRLFGVDGYLLVSPLIRASRQIRSGLAVPRPPRRNRALRLVDTQPEGTTTHWRAASTTPDEDTRPDWSPSGRSIAFARLQGGTATLMVVPASGGPAHRLGRGWEPNWAPSGQEIAFVRRDNGYVCRPDGTGVRKVVSAVGAASPDFAPDGTRLAYGAAGSVWVVPSSGGVPVKIADGISGDLEWG